MRFPFFPDSIMAQQPPPQMFKSTPLDQLGSGGGGDMSHMNNILADLNSMGSQQAPQHQPPQYQQAPPDYRDPFQERIISEPPVSMSPGQYRMDPVPPQANVIGGARPTMEDFRSMMNPAPSGMTPFQPFRPPGAEEVFMPLSAKIPDWRTTTIQFLRSPLIVAIIVFILNLPVVTGLLSRYAVWMYLSSGEISVSGLLVKSLLGACLFALYQMSATLWEKN